MLTGRCHKHRVVWAFVVGSHLSLISTEMKRISQCKQPLLLTAFLTSLRTSVSDGAFRTTTNVHSERHPSRNAPFESPIATDGSDSRQPQPAAAVLG